MHDYYQQIEKEITDLGFRIIEKELNRPWGGFLVIDPDQVLKFQNIFFTKISSDFLSGSFSSPKVLIIDPYKRLSWQYHNRRRELWSVWKGSVGVILSETDTQGEIQTLKTGDQIEINLKQRHRIVGKNYFGVIAEIWIHTNESSLSDEEDIIRLDDDFNR